VFQLAFTNIIEEIRSRYFKHPSTMLLSEEANCKEDEEDKEDEGDEGDEGNAEHDEGYAEDDENDKHGKCVQDGQQRENNDRPTFHHQLMKRRPGRRYGHKTTKHVYSAMEVYPVYLPCRADLSLITDEHPSMVMTYKERHFSSGIHVLLLSPTSTNPEYGFNSTHIS
jgi:hypothetical protein